MITIWQEARNLLHMTQEELASSLHTTAVTVSRWENGKSIPNKSMQSTLYQYCKERGISLYASTLQRIKAEEKALLLPSERILLYHGSKSGITGDIEPCSREQCDFGKGFYMGTVPQQPLALVCDFPKAKFYLVSVDKTDLKTVSVEPDLDWALLISYYRGYMKPDSPLYSKYKAFTNNADLIFGCIANDRMYMVMEQFFGNTITDAALIHCLSALDLGQQYTAVTQKACNAIKIEKEISISFFEWQFIRDESSANREHGKNITSSIARQYRREGRYYDEITGGDADA